MREEAVCTISIGESKEGYELLNYLLTEQFEGTSGSAYLAVAAGSNVFTG